MKTDTKDKIISYLKNNQLVSAHNLTNYLGLSQRSIFKQLKSLVNQGLIGKIGKPPKVFYHLISSKKIIDIPAKSLWQLLEKEDYANYLFVAAPWEGYSKLVKDWGFINGRYLGAEYSHKACNLLTLKSEYDQMNKIHFAMLFNQTKSWDNLHRITFKNSAKMFSWAKSIKSLTPSKLSDKKLVAIIEEFNKLQQAVHCPRGPMWSLETPFNIVSDYLRSYLEEQAVEIRNIKTKPYLAFQILTTSLINSVWMEEENELIKICQITDKGKRIKKLKQHVLKYEWLEYGLEGKILSADDFKQRVDKILRKNPTVVADRLAAEKKIVAKKQAELVREYQVDAKHQKIFAIVRDSIAARLYSKDSQFFGYYALEKIFQEFGQRTGLNLEQVKYLAPKDFAAALINKKDFTQITNQRMSYSLHISDNGETVFYQGAEARRIRKKIKLNLIENQVEMAKIIKGQPAYKGVVKGRVKIVNTINEIFKIHQGNILVSRMTNPSIVPAMKKAAAIITDMGGITCHAAIIARELRKPCVIGTKVATQVFRDGDLIMVDANEGIVKKVVDNP